MQRDPNASFLNPTTKKRIVETEKENSRIYMKVKTASSTLNRERMLSDYAKAQKIKDRIAKYANDHNRVTLKYVVFEAGPRNTSATTAAQCPRALSTAAPSTSRKTS